MGGKTELERLILISIQIDCSFCSSFQIYESTGPFPETEEESGMHSLNIVKLALDDETGSKGAVEARMD